MEKLKLERSIQPLKLHEPAFVTPRGTGKIALFPELAGIKSQKKSCVKKATGNCVMYPKKGFGQTNTKYISKFAQRLLPKDFFYPLPAKKAEPVPSLALVRTPSLSRLPQDSRIFHTDHQTLTHIPLSSNSKTIESRLMERQIQTRGNATQLELKKNCLTFDEEDPITPRWNNLENTPFEEEQSLLCDSEFIPVRETEPAESSNILKKYCILKAWPTFNKICKTERNNTRNIQKLGISKFSHIFASGRMGKASRPDLNKLLSICLLHKKKIDPGARYEEPSNNNLYEPIDPTQSGNISTASGSTQSLEKIFMKKSKLEKHHRVFKI